MSHAVEDVGHGERSTSCHPSGVADGRGRGRGRPRRRSPGAGLTLVEVIVAVVVCGAGIAVAALALTATVRAEARVGDLDRASAEADLLLARYEAGILPLEDAEGDFTSDGAPDLTWTVVVEQSDLAGLSDLALTVRWTRQGGEHDLVLHRWLFTDPKTGTR